MMAMRSRNRRCRGFSMVELLVGTAVGLLVVAAASVLVSQHMRDARALASETRLMQDLRSAADMVSRDLRRAGYWGHAASGVAGDDGLPVAANPYADISPAASASDATSFRYSRDATENDLVDDNEQFGFRLHNGAIELELGDANWQALTDATTLTVTTFAIVPRIEETSLAAFCTEPCLAGSTTCPPKQQVKSFALSISGRSSVDAGVVRSVQGEVHLRNVPIVGSCGS
jgi:type IV pilus assembly protein PilW